MSRPIKFRAWDKNAKRMIHNFAHVGETGQMFTIHAPLNDYEVMQFTGLKDRNGVEIYEGDIVQHYDWGQPRQAKGVVHWRMYFWCFGKSPKHKTWYQFSDVVGHEGEIVEVIGNIYENKNLLEDK